MGQSGAETTPSLAGGRRRLAAAFGKHGLITEYIVSAIPMILGVGALRFAGKGSRSRRAGGIHVEPHNHALR